MAAATASRPGLRTGEIEAAAALHQAGRLDEAQALYIDLAKGPSAQRRIVLQLLALVERQRGRPGEALAAYDQLLAMGERSAALFAERGGVLQALGRPADALASYDQALRLAPGHAEILNDRAGVLEALGRGDEALVAYDAAVRLRPGFAAALNNRAILLQARGRLDEAMSSYDEALAADPGLVVAWNNRSTVLRRLKQGEAALQSADRALQLRPDYPEALNSRAAALHALDRFEEAVETCRRALDQRPSFPEALNTQGLALAALGRFEAALDRYQAALALDPAYAEARFNAALVLLRLGRMDVGWQAYEARWRRPGQPGPTFPDQTLWRGDGEVAGRRVLLHCEQGLGDTLQFCRYARFVAEMGAQVTLQVQPALKTLMSDLVGVHRLVGTDEPAPPFDRHAPLLSLPLATGVSLDPGPGGAAYLSADPARMQAWRARLPRSTRPRPRVGLAWAGNPAHENDRNRSIPLATLAPLLACDVQVVSLQTPLRAGDAARLDHRGDVVRVEDQLRDFADTAALIVLCDLVISVDTSVAHLAGALGKPVWILLPQVGDWRWMEGEASPWYRTAWLARQKVLGDWPEVVERVAARLESFHPENGSL